MQAEGTFEYEALLFLPSQAPLDLFQRGGKRGVQLYVKRVFIMDDCEALMPDYLRFVKGVVDAHDLSLNVSREILQQDRQIQLIRRRLVKKVLSTVKDMMADDAGAATRRSGREFGRVAQGGPARRLRQPRRDPRRLPRSPRPTTRRSSTTLPQYVDRMKEGQEEIYFMTGESRPAIENSPHMEAFQAKGYEVLLLTDPVDEVWVDAVPEFDGKQLRSIAKGEVDLDTDEEKKDGRGRARAAAAGLRRRC